MGLGIEKQAGDFLPWVKFNSNSGRWSAKIDGAEQEIANPTFVADFANILTGWIEFGAPGMPPVWTPHTSLTNKIPRPNDKSKEGFKVKLFSKSSFGGVVEMMSNSMHLTSAISEMYDKYEAEVANNVGKLPVIKCVGIETMKDKMGTNYKPKFSFEKFVDRPTEIDAVSTTVQQSKPAPTQQVAANNVSDF